MLKKILNALYPRPLSLAAPADWAYAPPLQTAGQCVNERTAVSLSAVHACVRLISQTVSTLPLKVYERLDDDTRRLAKGHPLARLISRRPNSETTAATFWQAVVASMLLRDAAYIRVRKIGGRPVSLQFLHRDRLSAYTDSYRYLQHDGTTVEIPQREVIRIVGFTLDGVNGVSAIEYGATIFGSALAGANAAAGTFERGLMPTVYIKNETVIQKEQREQFRESMGRVVGALNAGKIPVLERGQEIKPAGILPKDAQLLESRSFSIEEICRFFGVPPHMIGHNEKSTSWGSGLEQQNIAFLTYTLAPLLRCIEEAISLHLLSPAEVETHYAEFSVEGLLRADMAARAEFYAKMTSNGIITRDECRRKENLPEMGGNASVLTVQSAMTKLDNI